MHPRCLTSGSEADYAGTPDQKLKPLNIKRFSSQLKKFRKLVKVHLDPPLSFSPLPRPPWMEI